VISFGEQFLREKGTKFIGEEAFPSGEGDLEKLIPIFSFCHNF